MYWSRTLRFSVSYHSQVLIRTGSDHRSRSASVFPSSNQRKFGGFVFLCAERITSLALFAHRGHTGRMIAALHRNRGSCPWAWSLDSGRNDRGNPCQVVAAFHLRIGNSAPHRRGDGWERAARRRSKRGHRSGPRGFNRSRYSSELHVSLTIRVFWSKSTARNQHVSSSNNVDAEGGLPCKIGLNRFIIERPIGATASSAHFAHLAAD